MEQIVSMFYPTDQHEVKIQQVLDILTIQDENDCQNQLIENLEELGFEDLTFIFENRNEIVLRRKFEIF